VRALSPAASAPRLTAHRAGKHWVNPSANQLFRALQRKNKPIEHADAMDVAQVHNMVTEESWKGVMQYEALHAGSCAQPTLAKFQGMDGIYSAKARFSHLMGWTPLPFDRHDWTVNRCGKEVRYIIDYYAVEEKDGDISYFIDARPAPTLGGVYDRVRLAARKWWRGEKVW
jgi:cytochrome c heme-lyase